MDLYEAIRERRSVRKYRMEAVTPETLEKIGAFYERIEPLFPGIETEIGISDNISCRKKRRGFFAVTAPYYLLFYSKEQDRAEMNAGYICEQIALYLITLGLGSCFQGGMARSCRPQERNGLKLMVVMAFGPAEGRLTRRPEDAKRLAMKDLCVFKNEPACWMHEVIGAARLAPSAFNRQPWRFVVVGSRIHIFSIKNGMDRPKPWEECNFGAMFAHIAVASEELWLDVDLIRLENISQKNFRSNQYVLSAIVKNQEA